MLTLQTARQIWRKNGMPIRIVIADDHEPARRGIRSLLARQSDWSICGEAADGREAVELARKFHPDVILMDISMPRMNGIEATRAIRREMPGTEVIIVSQFDPKMIQGQAQEIGAAACVAKSNVAADLVPAIQQTLSDKNPGRGGATNAPAGVFFVGGGIMGEILRATDWSQSPLGVPETWSPTLRMMTKFLLANRFPQILWWGSQFCSLYNDAYVPILGGKHPWAFGRPVQEIWHEIWHVLKPLIETPFHGGPPTWMEDILLEVNRRDFFEETHFTIAYSPVPDETVPGGIGGVLATVNEITDKVIGERRIGLLRDLGARLVEPKTAEEACTIAAETLSRHPKDVPFALLYLLDRDQQARFVCATGVKSNDRGCPPLIDVSAKTEGQWPISKVLESSEIQLVHDVASRFREVPLGPWSDPPNSAAILPVGSNITHQPAGILIVGLSPRLAFDGKYRDFLNLMSTQIATSIATACAYEEERKRAEALAEIDRAKTLFFNNVSHEFRTPVALILGPLEDVLSTPTGLPQDQYKRIETAHRNSLRLLKLVNTLLDFSRIEAGRIEASYEPTDLAALTSDLASVFRAAVERAGLRLTIDCPPLAEPVYVDREMWEKIVFNLISNAFKFTFSGQIVVALRNAEEGVELMVRDTGTGIPPADVPHLFERFYRVKSAQGRTIEGSGIGLALVQELARLHGGSVRVESEMNRGSTFIVTVPYGKKHLPEGRIGAARAQTSTALRGDDYVQEALRWLPSLPSDLNDARTNFPAPAVEPARQPAGRDSLARPSILLADDNADMREYLHRLLQDRYDVLAAGDGQSALERIREQHPDLVLADVMMPRLDGFALLHALRADAKLNTIPVILVSARAGEESRIEGLRAGADDYLVKPFSARELLARVESQLSLAGLRRHAAELERQLREKAEREQQILRESEERFRALVNASSYAVYRMNPDWSEIRHLDGGGFLADIPQLRKDWLEKYIPPDDQPALLQAIREAVRTKTMFQLEHRVRRADGTLGWSFSRAVPLMDENGEITEWFGAASDVTTRKEAENNFRELAGKLDAEVRIRTRELENRNAEVVRQSDSVRQLSRQLLQAQDEERRRVARELHDSAGQILAVLGMKLGDLAQGPDARPEYSQSVEDAAELVQQLTKEIRTTSYLLHPPLLDEIGLRAALDWYVSGLSERSNLQVSVTIAEDFGRLPQEIELAIFRLIQECLTNIHRHSGSKTAFIEMRRERDHVIVEVRDEGRGIPADKIEEIRTRGSGVGIRGMRERLRHLGGELSIEPANPGTTVLATIPIPADAPASGSFSEDSGEPAEAPPRADEPSLKAAAPKPMTEPAVATPTVPKNIPPAATPTKEKRRIRAPKQL